MHGLSTTSQRPFNVPPQGPFLIPLGQVCGQTYSMWPRTQLPQAWQPKRGDLIANSNRSTPRASFGRLSIQRKIEVRKSRSLPGLLTGNKWPRVSRRRAMGAPPEVAVLLGRAEPGFFDEACEESYK